jgi:hypothetical protein
MAALALTASLLAEVSLPDGASAWVAAGGGMGVKRLRPFGFPCANGDSWSAQ